MATLCSLRGSPAKLRTSSASVSYDGRPWTVSASTVLSSSLDHGSNEKEVMQNLNSRLASYLEKVCALEKSNQQLEIQIREKLSEKAIVKKDYSDYFTLINTLRKQITDTVSENTKLLLAIDNSKLAADDFKEKWNTECALRQSVERDMNALRKVRDDHAVICDSLSTDVDSLQSELLTLKKDHKEDLAALREKLDRGKVEVAVDAVQGPDLTSILAEVRAQYEDVIKKNKEEADALFHTQYETLTLQLAKDDEDIRKAQDEVRERRTVLQGLQLELETTVNQVNALRHNLDETELRYKKELERLQGNIIIVEQELSELLKTIQNNKLEYEALWKIKETLEAEIAEYRRLLDGEPQETIVIPEPREPDIRTKKIVKTVTQTLVDGKIVGESSEVEEYEHAEKVKK
ncbi:keratin, type I cytoskeletal 18-like [Hyla sarda]|uniref:keratin, type I cytoskeletal 18-like n=1 Tax=Hyla sarda TaxID=327740 RepID=UPI0024C2D3B8|nr:keratin, type I cytoskeletal 18-like [Hyla sarda]XP_056394831.1 keratin, type I cytoskeletal 18-like [Hyla sarda]